MFETLNLPHAEYLRAWSAITGFWYSCISLLPTEDILSKDGSKSNTDLYSIHTELAFSKIHFLPYCFPFESSSVQLLETTLVSEHIVALEPVRKQVGPLWPSGVYPSGVWSGYLCLRVPHKSLRDGGFLESGKFSVKFFKKTNLFFRCI